MCAGAVPALRSIIGAATYTQRCCMQHLWVHQRRSFIDCAAGHVRLTRWCQGWIERVAGIYRLNKARLEHYDPGLAHPAPEFDAAQGELEAVVERLFADAEAELAGLSDKALRAKPLRSLLNHREGLASSSTSHRFRWITIAPSLP